MKVLLTGASGFVGSHLLDALRARNIATVLLLRPASDRQFITPHLRDLEVRTGSIADLDSLKTALDDVTHVIHCAGCIKAARSGDFYAVNQVGTRNVVAAVNTHSTRIQHLIHVSSMAAAGPATPARPAREMDPPAPVSVYGRSKLAAELEVRDQCRVPYTILRPPAVYGPRDRGFLPIFKAVRNHLRPRPSAAQALSLVYAPDLAAAAVSVLGQPKAAGQSYFVCSPEITTGRAVADEVARQMNGWTLPCPLPPMVLWPVCLGQEIYARVTGQAVMLNLQKFAELRAPGWVCDGSKLKSETGCECRTPLPEGIAATLAWYTRNAWL